jgi:hypothetical protein
MSLRAVRNVVFVALALGLAGAGAPRAQSGAREGVGAATSPVLDWPVPTPTARPWTRWWWHGSSVTRHGLTAAMEAYQAAGLGGLELTPIYGVRGEEERFVPYLSPAWMALLDHTMAEATRLGLGLDMATGTGWPFGGPWVSRDEASRNLVVKKFPVAGGARLVEPVLARQEPVVRAVGRMVYDLRGSILGPATDDGKPVAEAAAPAQPRDRPIAIGDLTDPTSSNRNLQALALDQVRFPRDLPLASVVAYSSAGEWLDLTGQVGAGGRLDWVAPAGTWTVYALFEGWHGKQVERAAPGGEGDVIDHFSAHAIRTYLSRFDRAFAGHDVSPVRAFFNDSYEVDDANGQADWTPGLLEAFRARRGYDLRQYLPALLGEDTPERSARVLADYRETVSDLLLETFTTEWRDWAAGKRALIRNQAHGSPANILDLYAASGVPEIEGTDLLRIKFASSSGHVTGKPLISAEAATWLDDHFLSPLGSVKQALDRFFVGGVNHVVYHGTAYSPQEAPWPGWLFYAAVHFQPTNPMWGDFRTLNEYVTRVQGFLQQGQPDADVLVYFPFHDFLMQRGRGLLQHFDGGGALMQGSSFKQVSEALLAKGYAFDYVSDRQVASLAATPKGVRAAGTNYGAILVPELRVFPLETAEKLVSLARDGATLLLVGQATGEVAGFHQLAERRAAFERLASQFSWTSDGSGIREARIGSGRVLAGGTAEALLARAGIVREAMADSALQYTRRTIDGAPAYFIVNHGTAEVDGWVPLVRSGASAALFDPLRGRRGVARLRERAAGGHEVYLQLAASESCVLRFSRDAVTGPAFPYVTPAGERTAVGGTWRLEFVAGGPALPPAVSLTTLGSWTALGGEAVRAFSGTARYTVSLPRPAGSASTWRLDLGTVRESARVTFNGRLLAVLTGAPYVVDIPADAFRASNELRVEVSNLMANRIADMDRRGVRWKRFYNVNMPASRPENRGPDGLFDAAKWEPRESGLLGPVTLTPMRGL